MSDTKVDAMPGLGFKDKEKALETIRNLDGRDPDYQRLAIKGLIGRAKRTLTLTKDKDKLKNINEALSIFDKWLLNFEKNNLSKENRAYLPLAAIKTLLPLKKHYKIDNNQVDSFLEAYENVDGDYKSLRTVSSGDNQPTWDIVRNSELKNLLKTIDDEKTDLWKDELPTKEHMELILWAYSPYASQIKKNLAKLEDKLSDLCIDDDEDDKDKDDNDDDKDKDKDKDDSDDNDKDGSESSKEEAKDEKKEEQTGEKEEKGSKRKSESSDENPRKKKKE